MFKGKSTFRMQLQDYIKTKMLDFIHKRSKMINFRTFKIVLLATINSIILTAVLLLNLYAVLLKIYDQRRKDVVVFLVRLCCIFHQWRKMNTTCLLSTNLWRILITFVTCIMIFHFHLWCKSKTSKDLYRCFCFFKVKFFLKKIPKDAICTLHQFARCTMQAITMGRYMKRNHFKML